MRVTLTNHIGNFVITVVLKKAKTATPEQWRFSGKQNLQIWIELRVKNRWRFCDALLRLYCTTVPENVKQQNRVWKNSRLTLIFPSVLTNIAYHVNIKPALKKAGITEDKAGGYWLSDISCKGGENHARYFNDTYR